MRRRENALVLIGVAVLLFVSTVAFVCYRLRQPSAPPNFTSSASAFHDCDIERFKPIRISDFFTANNVVKSSKPLYPEEAHSRDVTGQVDVKLLIDLETGRVERTCAYSGPPELWLAAEQAAAKWQFKTPSQPVGSKYALDFLTFNFVR